MAIHEQESRNQAVYESITLRTEQFHNAHKERLDSQNISHIWEYLGWTPREWEEYLEKRTIPLCEFKGKQVPVKETNHFPITRHFTTPDIHPFDGITWEIRQALITKADGEVVFQQDEVEFPSFWSQNATNIVASKYFRTIYGEKENSVKEMIDRVVRTIAHWGLDDAYFSDSVEYWNFLSELQYILVNQLASFNSPVWFNIGVPGTAQQASACYILSVEDSMPAILEWYRQEGMIFSRGSGSGVNVSKLRAKGEPISKGGVSSGPLSFMRAADASAFSIKSGGTTRRSARMVVMDMDHPDIEEFINAKMREENKARILAQAGYDDSLDGEIYATVAHQNCNMSVSASDEFLQKVADYEVWCTKNRTNYEGQEHKAEYLFRKIAEAAWSCGDPGIQFQTTLNNWHTCPNSGNIESSNPCAEYVFLNDTACNLSSINLLKFLKDDNTFDIEGFKHTVNVMITAMEILVSRSEYPTEAITQNSEDFRTLGLGYANLGALLMAKGLPYDSDEGRDYAASITALMTGQAYKRSAELAAIKGPFNGFVANRQPMLDIIFKHIGYSSSADILGDSPIYEQANDIWIKAFEMGKEYGYRNAQVTLLAPTGTISFMMDCTTTGVEPDVALVNYKKLVGGGTIKHVNDIVPRALKSLGYKLHEPSAFGPSIQHITACIEKGHDLEATDTIAPIHLPVFDCAFPSKPGGRAIAWEGHVKMGAALQPFLSGSISKTINMPNDSTVEDIERAYMMAWELGCKTISVYRDGCKQTQVLTTQNTESPVKINDDGYTESHFIANAIANAKEHWQNRVGICQACGGSNRVLVSPYGASPALVCTACMDSINQRIQAENTGVEVDNNYWIGKIGALQNEIQALEYHIQHEMKQPQRRRLPDERAAITHKFSINNQEGYLTIGLFEDGTPGEIFLKMAKEGSTLSGFADGFATMVSLGLQYGIPLEAMVTKFSHSRFEPAGWTPHEDIHYASSILDYIFRYLQYKFLNPVPTPVDKVNIVEHTGDLPLYSSSTAQLWTDAHNVCPICGNMLYVNGACQVCKSCGFNSGCSG